MAVAHFKLNNLVVILDNNSFQQTGTNEEIMSSGSLKDKFESFNWNAIEIDGHNLNQIYDLLLKVKKLKINQRL